MCAALCKPLIAVYNNKKRSSLLTAPDEANAVLIEGNAVHLVFASPMPASPRLGIGVALHLESIQLSGCGAVMVKVRLQTAHHMRLRASGIRLGKGALHGHIGRCDQNNTNQCNKNDSGSRFGHDFTLLVNLFA